MSGFLVLISVRCPFRGWQGMFLAKVCQQFVCRIVICRQPNSVTNTSRRHSGTTGWLMTLVALWRWNSSHVLADCPCENFYTVNVTQKWRMWDWAVIQGASLSTSTVVGWLWLGLHDGKWDSSLQHTSLSYIYRPQKWAIVEMSQCFAPSVV